MRFFPALAVLTVLPLLVALFGGVWHVFWPLLPSTLLCAWLGVQALRTAPPRDVTEAEDAIAVALAFPLGLVVSSAPYLWCDLSFLDAVFEGMSGITGTGLTRYTDIDAQPFALHFLRAWQQWIGGYAIVTLTVALLPRRAKRAQKMAESDIADDAGKKGDEKPNLAERAKQVTLVYGVLTVVCILLTWATGFPFHQSLLHGLTAVSTAGFSSLNNSLTDVPHLTTACLMGFSLLGAVALSDYIRPAVEQAGLRKLAGVLLVLLVLSAGFGLGVFFVERAGPAPVALFDALQVASSAQSTTGFSSLSVPDLTGTSKALLIASMYIGGDLGSTAGGIKLMRFAALALALYAVFRPRADLPDTPGDGASGALRLIAAWAGFSVLGWLCLVMAGHAPIDALFEWASALNNTGLTAGPSSEGTPPVLTRIVLIFGMWLGRVEILAALLLLKASVWRH